MQYGDADAADGRRMERAHGYTRGSRTRPCRAATHTPRARPLRAHALSTHGARLCLWMGGFLYIYLLTYSFIHSFIHSFIYFVDIPRWFGAADVATFLLSKGADATALDMSAKTPLMLASAQGHAQIVQILLAHVSALGKGTSCVGFVNSRVTGR